MFTTNKFILSLVAALPITGPARPAGREADLETLCGKAAGGDAQGQFDLVLRLSDGNGVNKDNAQAMKWAPQAEDYSMPPVSLDALHKRQLYLLICSTNRALPTGTGHGMTAA